MISVRHEDSDCNEQDQSANRAAGGRAVRHLNRMAKNERERPNRTMEMAVPATDVKRMGLRPVWSESRLQWNPITALAAKCRDI